MKRCLFLLPVLCLCPLLPCLGAAAARPKPKSAATAPKPPTKATVLTLADGYITAIGPRLTGEDFQTINGLKFDLTTYKDQPVFFKPLINDRISQFTVMLSAGKSLPGLTVACAWLVHYAPANARAANLLANVVALLPKRDDAVFLLEYALQLQPDSTLAMINLANAYMNANRDEKARPLLEKVVTIDPKNGRAYRMLACYWYKKGDNRKTVDYLMKAAALNGARLKKSKKNQETTQKNETQANDGEEVLEQKADAMKDLVPLNTADLVEDDFPDVARKIRDHVEKLMDSERMKLPMLPQMNTNDLKDYVRNKPVYTEWVTVVAERANAAMKEIALAKAAEMGISPADSDKVKEQKARAAAQKQMAEAMKNAAKTLNAMKNVPGMSKEQIARAQRELSNAARRQKINIPPPSEEDEEPSGPPDLTDITDTGGMFAAQNYGDYLRVKGTYINYFMTSFRKYNEKVAAIAEAYGKLAKAENDYHEQRNKDIDEREERARKAAENADAAFDATPYDLERKKERLRHVRKMNEYGSNFYRQWVNLYMPQYAQKFRPRLEEFWYVTTLYIRNMNNPKLMKREYETIRQFYWMFAAQATGAIGGGEMFPYSPESEEEEAQLEAEIHAMEIEAEQQRQRLFEPQTKVADNALPKWLEDKLVLSVACEFLAIKITPRNIEFEAYIPGLSGKVDYNFKDNTVTTSTALAAKLNIGVQIGPLEAKLEGEVKMLGSKTTFDLNNGKVQESSDGFASGTIKGTFGKSDSEWKGWSAGGDPDSGGLKARVGATVQVDPALDNEVSGKVFMTAPGVNGEAKF